MVIAVNRAGKDLKRAGRAAALLALAAAGAAAIFVAGCGAAESRPVTITFKITPAALPEGDTVFIVGNHPDLGDWLPGAAPMDRQPDGSWKKSVTVPAGTLIEYKITRGSWQTEMLREGEPITKNLIHVALKSATVNVDFSGWKDQVYKLHGRVTGTVITHERLEGDHLPPRNVLVWLPTGYNTSTNRYPVLYVHDGQNVFDPATSFAGEEWKLDEAADTLIGRGKLRELIIVGIHNTADRDVEYNDTQQGRYYMDFLTARLKPFVDSTYRTLPDRANTATMGSSIGGTIAFLLAWHHPEVFSRAACVSPAFFRKITWAVEADTAPKRDITFYIDNGGLGLDQQRQEGVDKMIGLLQAKGWEMGRDLFYFHDELADHNERSWAARIWRPLIAVFGVEGDSAAVR